jgi:hypothetical protein
MVAERARVRRGDQTTAGDLDVVAVDPLQRKGICLEIKWPIDAITSEEVQKTEDWVSSAAVQVQRLRGELMADDVKAEFPSGWPMFDDIDWTWAVGTPQQLTIRPAPVDDLHVTSLRYVMSAGIPNHIPQLVALLKDPDLPTEGKHFRIAKAAAPIDGRSMAYVDAIALMVNEWRPALSPLS